MNNDLKKVTGFLAGFLLLAVCLHHVLLTGLRRSRSDELGVWNTIVHGRAKADILISGSSTALVQFDCTIISQKTQKSCFNIGLNGSEVYLQLPLLKIYLAHHDPPEVIIQVLNWHDINLQPPFKPYQFIPYLNEAHLYKSLSRIWPDVIKHKYIPLFSFAIFNKELNGLAMEGLFNIPGYTDRRRTLGYYAIDASRRWERDFFFPLPRVIPVDQRSLKSLRELIAVGQEKGTQIIFVIPPAFEETLTYYSNVNTILEIYQKIAAEFGIPLLNYSRHPLTRQKELFYNSQHLYRRGAELFSQEFSRDLKALLEH